MDVSSSLEEAIAIVVAHQKITYLHVATLALISYDYFMTLPFEITDMWDGKKISAIKVAFFCARYLPFVQTILIIVYSMPLTGMNPRECSIVFGFSVSVKFIGILSAEAILLLRVYAFSGGNPVVQIYLLFHFIAFHLSTEAALQGIALKIVKHLTLPLSGGSFCYPDPNTIKHTLLFGFYFILGVSQLLTMIIMIWFGWKKQHSSPLLSIFYRDGIFYFVCVTALSVANAIFILAASPNYGLLLLDTQGVFHALLATRMVMNLRAYSRKMIANGSNQLSELRFAHPRSTGVEFGVEIHSPVENTSRNRGTSRPSS